ncbi:hypothetical protein PUMCH_002487 [Australozyma saopauloensis]|uniref:Uncharacterized protein n=1 Tax=Australozyma saopauloensis TaxID=291208 RepID=A0AAX4H9J4_9ASCO|nr:hypothetical protein PUMCH_002487 [[Candida] saopauloensis]
MRQPLEELLYQKLIQSPVFNSWVRRIHARINRIPLEEQSFSAHRIVDINDYTPTTWHKINAFRIIFADELKKAFLFR